MASNEQSKGVWWPVSRGISASLGRDLCGTRVGSSGIGTKCARYCCGIGVRDATRESVMSLQKELANELKDAMRARDKARTSVIRQVQTEIAVAKSAPGFTGEIDDELYKTTIVSYVKKMDKARLEFEALGERGAEQAAKLAYEVEYLSRWTPRLPGEEETREIVRAAIAELGVDDPKMMGRVMGHIMKTGVELDGGLVNRLVREELGA